MESLPMSQWHNCEGKHLVVWMVIVVATISCLRTPLGSPWHGQAFIYLAATAIEHPFSKTAAERDNTTRPQSLFLMVHLEFNNKYQPKHHNHIPHIISFKATKAQLTHHNIFQNIIKSPIVLFATRSQWQRSYRIANRTLDSHEYSSSIVYQQHQRRLRW